MVFSNVCAAILLSCVTSSVASALKICIASRSFFDGTETSYGDILRCNNLKNISSTEVRVLLKSIKRYCFQVLFQRQGKGKLFSLFTVGPFVQLCKEKRYYQLLSRHWVYSGLLSS